MNVEVYKIQAMEIAEDPTTFRNRYVGMRVGLGGASEDEWLVSFYPVIYGTLEMPEEGEPVVCVVLNREGTKVTPDPCVLQHLTATTWINCYDGTVFDLENGEQVIPLSGFSRMAGMGKLQVWEGNDGP